MTTEHSIMSYIADTWMGGDATGLDADVPLVELNIIDSADIFELVHHLQEQYRVAVPLREISPPNFRTVATIAQLIDRLQEAGVR